MEIISRYRLLFRNARECLRTSTVTLNASILTSNRSLQIRTKLIKVRWLHSGDWSSLFPIRDLNSFSSCSCLKCLHLYSRRLRRLFWLTSFRHPARDAWCIYRLTPAVLSALYSTGSAVTCVFCCLKTAELGDITIRADGSATLLQKFMWLLYLLMRSSSAFQFDDTQVACQVVRKCASCAGGSEISSWHRERFMTY